MILEDVILYIYDEEDAYRIRELASLTGATILNEIVPGLVTHIVAKEETPHLS